MENRHGVAFVFISEEKDSKLIKKIKTMEYIEKCIKKNTLIDIHTDTSNRTYAIIQEKKPGPPWLSQNKVEGHGKMWKLGFPIKAGGQGKKQTKTDHI